MKKRIFSLVAAAAVILTLFTGCAKNENVPGYFGGFETTTLTGETVSEDILKGNKLTMVNIWATYCSPCINEMPDLQKISETYEDKGVRVIGIVLDTYDYSAKENSAYMIGRAEEIVKQTGVKYTNILPTAELNKAKLDNVFSVPTTCFLDEDGEIIGVEYVGSRSFEQWSEIIDSLI